MFSSLVHRAATYFFFIFSCKRSQRRDTSFHNHIAHTTCCFFKVVGCLCFDEGQRKEVSCGHFFAICFLFLLAIRFRESSLESQHRHNTRRHLRIRRKMLLRKNKLHKDSLLECMFELFCVFFLFSLPSVVDYKVKLR
jgi:hypothetical protein